MTQWFGSALQLTPHLHILVPEAVWDTTGEVTLLPPPSDDAVEQVVQRVVRQVRSAFAKVEGCEWQDEEEELSRLQAEAVQGRLALDVDEAARKGRRRVAVACGFSLHANTWVHANDREGLERLGRYGARGPLAEERLSRLEDGRYRYVTRKGAALTLTAEQLVRRLLALVPPPKLHLTAWHGRVALGHLALASLRAFWRRRRGGRVPGCQGGGAPELNRLGASHGEDPERGTDRDVTSAR